ncbi:MAG: T9SS type A sorting domain-containing protein, partial [Patescibacteria group bacterium]|nr:T9SS type A sorting domain-containing protein [Patescibacteria group bacterium]
NDSNGIIKIYDNNEIEELVLINNNGILINGKNLIIRDKYNRTIIDNENIYASKIISENILINNKNLIVKSYDGIEEKNEKIVSNMNIQIYPNPSRGNFKLVCHLHNADNLKITLYDVTGRLVQN